MQKKISRSIVSPQKRPVSFTLQKPLAELTARERCLYLEQLIERLTQKQKRERAYLDRRAARGTHTPTDEAYEADQILEEELLFLLNGLLQAARAATAP
jgi:hypothetical protein